MWGWGLWESPPTRVFWFRVLGALGQGPRALILEFEYIRKPRLFATEKRAGLWHCGSGAVGVASNTCFLASCFGRPGPWASGFDSGA